MQPPARAAWVSRQVVGGPKTFIIMNVAKQGQVHPVEVEQVLDGVAGLVGCWGRGA